MSDSEVKKAFLNDLADLLEKYGAVVDVSEEWTGFDESESACSAGLRMTFELPDFDVQMPHWNFTPEEVRDMVGKV